MIRRAALSPAAPAPTAAGLDPPAELLSLAVTLLDVFWIQALLCVFADAGPAGRARIALWPLVALVLLARGVVLVLEWQPVAGAVYTTVVAGAGLLSLAGLIWVELYSAHALTDAAWLRALGRLDDNALRAGALLVAGGYLWWRTLAGAAPGLGAVYTRFGRILGAFVLFTIIAWLAQSPFMTPVLSRDLFGVFLVGLLALALARSQLERDRNHQLLSTRWFVFSLGLIALVLALGLLIGSLVAGDLAGALFGPLLTAVEWLGLALVFVVMAITLIVFTILDALFGAFRDDGQRSAQPNPLQGLQKLLHQLQSVPSGAAPPVDLTLFAVVGGLALLIAGLLVARAILQSAARRRHTLGGGERESLLNWAAVLQSLRGRDAVAPPPAPDPLLALARDPAYRATVRIRRAYRQALERAAGQDVRRLPAQTADEVLPALQSTFPAARAPLQDLTALYDGARYTTTPATPAAADAAEQALRALDPPR